MSEQVLKNFNEYLVNKKGFSKNTVNSYDRDLRKIFVYLEKNGYSTEDYSWLTEELALQYIDYLEKEKYSSATLSRTVSTIHVFVEFLYAENFIDKKISIDVKVNKHTEHEFVVFTKDEISQILNIEMKSWMDYRDKAIFELSYSIGIKPTECINLEVGDVNLTVGFLKYRKRDGYRNVPLNGEAVKAIGNYLRELKKVYPNVTDETKLFLNHDGEGISRQGYWKIFKKRQQELQLNKELNTMNFRNSLAVHLLEDNVSPNQVQELLGLKNIHSLKLHFNNLKTNNRSKRVIDNHPRKTID